jgi:hypothetical protein
MHDDENSHGWTERSVTNSQDIDGCQDRKLNEVVALLSLRFCKMK